MSMRDLHLHQPTLLQLPQLLQPPQGLLLLCGEPQALLLLRLLLPGEQRARGLPLLHGRLRAWRLLLLLLLHGRLRS